MTVTHTDNFFIQALARAASCQEHRRHKSTLREATTLTAKHHRTQKTSVLCSERKEYKSTTAGGPLKRIKQFAERELKALVDYYGINLETGPEPEPLDDSPLIWNVGDDHQPWPVKEDIHTTYIEKLEELLKDQETPHHQVYDAYRLLPSPGVVYLRKKTIHDLLNHLSIVERADQASMQRFLSILDDMKKAHIHIKHSEWTSAIYFAGRSLGKVTTDEVQSALYIWRDMEKRAGVKAGAVTLNVLFDIAVKAGKYTLAETFLKEMQARKLKVHRHFRVSLLYYYGVLQNGNGVRRTYQEIVSSGDIVDTVVMNAVIAALIRAGEPSAAEHVFERMKRLHATRTQSKPIPRGWRERRLLGLDMTYKSRRLAEIGDLEKQKELQDQASIAPDSRTYALLIRYYASTAGNIDRVQELLREMQYNQVPIEGAVYIVTLYGFNSFGGVRYSSWTRDKLEKIWAEYLKSVQCGVQRTWLSSMSVIVALRAFNKCTDPERTLQAWEEARRIWEPTPEELEKVLGVLRRLVPEHPFFHGNL